jgi:hypothetical protein
MIPCTTQKFFGIDCPGCGFQRSLLSFIQGDFVGSFQYYPPLYPILLLIFAGIINSRIDYKWNAEVLKISAYLSVISIVVNYLIKFF